MLVFEKMLVIGREGQGLEQKEMDGMKESDGV